jgi:hypothetical protein
MPRQGSRQARGYGRQHELQRQAWEPKVKRGGVHCHAKVCFMPARLILAGQTWDLGHNEDRTQWTGPEHTKCNRSEGGKRGRAKQLGTDGALRQSRAW